MRSFCRKTYVHKIPRFLGGGGYFGLGGGGKCRFYCYGRGDSSEKWWSVIQEVRMVICFLPTAAQGEAWAKQSLKSVNSLLAVRIKHSLCLNLVATIHFSLCSQKQWRVPRMAGPGRFPSEVWANSERTPSSEQIPDKHPKHSISLSFCATHLLKFWANLGWTLGVNSYYNPSLCKLKVWIVLEPWHFQRIPHLAPLGTYVPSFTFLHSPPVSAGF